jgi:HEAT repeat protein
LSSDTLEKLFDSDDAELRRQAVARARKDRQSAVEDLLFRGLADEDWRVRKEAVAALRERPLSSDLLERLVEALMPGDDVGLRNAAVQALGAHGEGAIAAVGAALPKLDADGLKLAAEALALTEHEAAMPWLRRLRNDRDPNVRAAAIEAVARVGQAAPEAAAQLLDEALDESDPFLKLVTLDVVRRLGLAPSWERLRSLLADPVLGSTGFELAARLGEPRSAPHFVREVERAMTRRAKVEPDFDESKANEAEARALRYVCRFCETSPSALAAARSALGGLSIEARDRVLEVCSASVSTPIGRDALLVLAIARDVRVAKVVLAALEDEGASASGYRAVEVLGDAMCDVLLGELASESEQKRALAVRLLSAIAVRGEDPRAKAALSVLSDSSPVVTRAWIDAVALIGEESDLERALEWFHDDAPPLVLRSAREAARALGLRYPSRAKEIAESIAPGDPRAECVCWFMAASLQPLVSARADLAFLSQAASSPAASTRLAAFAALAARRDPDALDLLVFALSDESAEVQQAAIRGLGQFRDEDGIAAGARYLIELFRSSDDPSLQIEVLRSLGTTRDARALDFLLERTTSEAALEAVAAL